MIRLISQKARIILVFFGLLLVIASCDLGRVYEVNKDLPNGKWALDSIQVFKVSIKDRSNKHNILLNIRNGYSYKYSNLYVKYYILDTSNTVLTSNKAELFLMDIKTGKPLGNGVGDIYEHQFKLLEQYDFPYLGDFKIKIKQYMRDPILTEIYSVGVRVENVMPK